MSTAYYGRAVPLALRRFARFSESNSIPVRFSSQAATSSIHMWVPVAAGEAAMSPAQSKQAESNSDSLERTGWTGLACREYIFSIFLVLSSFCLCQGFVTSRWTSDRQDLSSKHCDPCFPLNKTAMHLFDQGVHVVMLMTRRKHIEHADSWLGDSPCFFWEGRRLQSMAWDKHEWTSKSHFFCIHRCTHFIVFLHLAYWALFWAWKGP